MTALPCKVFASRWAREVMDARPDEAHAQVCEEEGSHGCVYVASHSYTYTACLTPGSKAKDLAGRFRENDAKYEISAEVRCAGPKV